MWQTWGEKNKQTIKNVVFDNGSLQTFIIHTLNVYIIIIYINILQFVLYFLLFFICSIFYVI